MKWDLYKEAFATAFLRHKEVFAACCQRWVTLQDGGLGRSAVEDLRPVIEAPVKPKSGSGGM
jgi:hypothetical protein